LFNKILAVAIHDDIFVVELKDIREIYWAQIPSDWRGLQLRIKGISWIYLSSVSRSVRPRGLGLLMVNLSTHGPAVVILSGVGRSRD
jgi:hypothetical protein